ncbi:hypothetical protein T02_9216 [Trichinella nativa]|uniref:MULE transposase domain-containing protein n=1 Tax=Trichinella nativa TaxID=6335 RepID=A0A0V1KVQ8_9BILA|nr:hypothetical protein T02_9216 [Trichinella nativa]
MADVPDLRLVPNCCGGMSLVYEGRAYKLKRSGKQKYWKDKKGCGGAIWTNLDVTSVIKQNDHIESCPVDEHLAYKMEKKALLKKLSAEETKPISAIYDEEASAEPSTSGCFPLCKRVKSTMYSHRAKQYPKLPNHRRDLQIPVPFKTTKADEDFLLWQCASRHILIFAAGSNIRLLRVPILDIRQPCEPGAWMVLSRLYHNGINNCLPSVPLWWISWCQQSTVDVRGYFPNTRVQGCYFHFCQAVHRKVEMLLATAFLPVPQVDTGVRLLEAGTTGTVGALFQYFRQEWMTDERLPLWNVYNVNMRTINHLEGWHSRLNRKVGKGHNGIGVRQELSGNATVGDLRRVNKVYAEKQQRVAQYTGEYTNGSRTKEQFLEALMYITPEPI